MEGVGEQWMLHVCLALALDRWKALVTLPFRTLSILETTHGQMDGFFSQLQFKCYLPEVVSVRD